MTIVVGFGPTTSRSVLQLAAGLAAPEQSIVLCGVVLDTWDGPSLATGLDPQWRRTRIKMMQDALDCASTHFTDANPVETVVRVGPSVPELLLAEAGRRQASVLAMGSSRRAALGRISLGSVSDQIVHSAQLPVAVTPNNGRRDTPEPIRRLVVCMQPADEQFAADEIVKFVAEFDKPVALVTFAVSPWPDVFPYDQVNYDALFTSMERHARTSQGVVADSLNKRGVSVAARQYISGYRWAQVISRIDWRPGDMLLLFSSRRGPVSRVFLGSTAARILRHAPVPTVVLPRTTR